MAQCCKFQCRTPTRAHAGADVLVERGRQRRGRDDAPEGAAVGAQEEGDGGERRPKRARRAPFPARRVERFHTLRVLLCARCKRAPPGWKQLAFLPAREGDARARVCVCVWGGGGQCARVARSTDNDGAQQYSAHASNHVTVRTNSYCGARAHNNTCKKATSAGASRRTAGCRKTHLLSRGPGSRLQARGNVHAQFRSALLDELDFGTRARGARAGMCKNEAPGLGPPTACSRTARPLRAPPAPPCAPAAARTSISMII